MSNSIIWFWWIFQGNAIYNIMPDVISRLSDPDIGVDEEHFRIIMKWVHYCLKKQSSRFGKYSQKYALSLQSMHWITNYALAFMNMHLTPKSACFKFLLICAKYCSILQLNALYPSVLPMHCWSKNKEHGGKAIWKCIRCRDFKIRHLCKITSFSKFLNCSSCWNEIEMLFSAKV